MNTNKTSKILAAIAADKNLRFDTAADAEQFCNSAEDYVKAIRNGAMCCTIPHVSASGMTRVINFYAAQPHQAEVKYRSYKILTSAHYECAGWYNFNI